MRHLKIKKSDKSRPASTLRRLRPAVKPPSESVLRRLSDDDRELISKRLAEPAECIYYPTFRRASIPELHVEVAVRRTPALRLAVPGRGAAFTGESQPTEVLSAADERALFLRFNYCRYRAMRILHRSRGRRLDAAATAELLKWERMAQQTRTDIVRANTSLVLAMARRSRNSGVELTELVSEGNLALLRCVDKFDASRGFKFSTYACRAILASFSRAAAKGARFRAHFPTTYDPAVERSDYLEHKRDRIELDCVDELKQILFENAADLSTVERRVLDARFSLGKDVSPPGNRRRTLDQVGLLLGVSKERVRQIQNQAMGKLRAALERRLLAS